MPQKQLSKFSNLPGRNAPGTDSENNVKKPLAKPRILRDTPTQSVSPRYHVTAQGIQGSLGSKHGHNLVPISAGHDGLSEGQERRKAAIQVTHERRRGYFAQTPDFAERAARNFAMMDRPEQFKLLSLKQASEYWLEERELHFKRPRTREAYQLYIRNLTRIMGEMRLCEIHIGHIVSYQQTRMKELTTRKKSPCVSYINHETNTLAQILKRAEMWDLVAKHYKPLPQGNWTPPKVLSPEDEERFFRIAAADPRWEVLDMACSLTNNTSAMGTELRHLQLQHIFLEQRPPAIHIPDGKVKNEFRARVIPLNAIAEKQIRRIVERAKKLGACRPEHHVFPLRVKRGTWDVTRPASPSFLRKPFNQVRSAMGPGYEWLQPRNFRNQVITKLFESGQADETIISIAGHQNIKMSRYYSRIRIGQKFEALNAILPKGKDVKNAG